MPSQPLIVDLHLDLTWDALFWNRDLTLPACKVRRQEENDIPQVAKGFDIIADLQGLPTVLRGAGTAEQGINGILHGNALRLFRRAWSN